ncbi:hypothetical protein [Acanthopleuribacter pedis]|uniref:Uncharacterized protein n=1 Tax=Acanthopleuribacter pedis TaxID=442870 RepID=A0A8J7QGT0_9BACT|nr:hypothetical protein [Acanthopleuribacter pedis]MBO1319865.1 hypothetical protein [Acanthopleuribacter pedis]
METWVEDYLRQIVAQPDEVTVSRSEGVRTIVYSVNLADADKSMFSGRNNRLLRALNHAVGFAGATTRTRHVVQIAD